MAILYQGSQFYKGNEFKDPKGNKLIFEKNTKKGKLFKTEKNHLIGLTESQVNRLKLISEEIDDLSDKDLQNDRVLFLSCEINDLNIEHLITEMLRLDRISRDDITIYINSNGGSVTAGFALYDIMNFIKSDIITICTGLCASMGAIIFINGTKGKRYILPNSEIMLHEVISENSGKYSEVEHEIQHQKETNDNLLKIISEKTGKSIETIRSDTLFKDKWFNSSSAVGYGLADKIIYSIDEIYK